jgi:protein SCO1
MFRGLVKHLILLSLLALLAACGKPAPPVFHSTDISGSNIGGDFMLVDQHGKNRSLADFKGKVVAVFFGFTHCPDICPTTLAELNSAVKKLGNEEGKTRVVFITVDPERDTPTVIAQYLSSFNPSFVGLSGERATIEKVATQFKIVHQKSDGATSNYRIDHSAGIYIFDMSGKLRLYANSDKDADMLSADIKLLLDGA